MSFFTPNGKTKDIRVVAISDWLDWASGNNDDFVLALPMIQRGSVWRPNQIIDLWDSLLRSMPIGSMLASELDRSTPVRRIGKHESEEAGDNALALLDGQQRTLAMLAGWNFPGSLQMDQRLWIDLGDEPTPGQLFHLHVTTKNRPFGFQHSAPSTKLSFGDRRKAMEKFEPLLCDEENSIEINDVLDRAWADHVKPGSAKTVHTYEMSVLVALWVKYRSKEKWRQQFYGNLDEDQKNVELHGERIEKLLSVIEGLFNLQIPVIPVDDSLFMDGDTDECDPPLAVLFKRIGTGGTALTDNDYIYSVIKHLLPQAYDLVETLHGDPALGVSRLLKPTDLVVSAVRLAIVNKWKEKDKESLDKKQFQSILKSGDFIKEEFLPLIEGKPGKGGKSDISNYFKSIQKTLLYDEENNPCGIPKQMFPLLGRPLVQVLLRLAQIGYIKIGMDCDARLDVLRLVLFWIIAVPSKRIYKRGTKARASKSAYAVIDGKDKSSSRIYGREICNQLVEDRLATRLFSPDEISDRNGLAESKESTTRLRGWNRFVSLENEDNDKHQEVYDFYYYHWWRAWTHHHPILLWLQREMVARDFGDPMAGRDEDTPYDFDHILPSSHWKDWRGRRRDNAGGLNKLSEDGKVRYEGNAIGNICVLSMSKNRKYGDDSPDVKLELSNPSKYELIIKDLAIFPAQISYWKTASGVSGSYRHWTDSRAKAFRSAVEQRTFALYKTFYETLEFGLWENPILHENSTSVNHAKET